MVLNLHRWLIHVYVDITGGASEQRKRRRNAKKLFDRTAKDRKAAGLLSKQITVSILAFALGCIPSFTLTVNVC